VARLERDGIAAMRLIAFGERLHADGLLESFVITEELAGYTQLDHYLRQRFAPRAERTGRDAGLEALIAAVADVARRFHAAGYNHRDLYCCHFFIRPEAGQQSDVRLIDLQRVEQRRWLRRRWIVKDLAQLAYSAPRERIGCRERIRFLRAYLGVRKLRPQDKRLIRAVTAKWRRMENHLGAHP
jgi:heptose I phosphotransferase